jgi:hypothetical protein
VVEQVDELAFEPSDSRAPFADACAYEADQYVARPPEMS